MSSSLLRFLWVSAVLVLLLSACATAAPPTPTDDAPTEPPLVDEQATPAEPTAPAEPTPPPEPTATETADYLLSSTSTLSESVSAALVSALERDGSWAFARPGATGDAQLSWARPGGDSTLLERHILPVVPFDTVQDDIALADLQARWQGNGQPLLVTESAMGGLEALWGPSGEGVVFTAGVHVPTLLEEQPGRIVLVTFDQLGPRMKALTLDGINLLSNQLQPGEWPLVAALQVEGEQATVLLDMLNSNLDREALPFTDRDPAKLTTLIMTGVTAMSRDTAAVMEREGDDYPAQVIADVLSAADITHVSNEVPFLDDCVVNATLNNLQLCSHTDYWATLAAIGTDIVGLSGNHVNDFGYEGARESIMWYRENGIPIYGSGLNEEEACAPLMWEHNGNRFAFIAALAFEPSYAWATDELPGACYFYNNKEEILALVERLSQEVDIVSVELQHVETYEPFPIDLQITEFRELRAAGADIVTGVQSHVPQAMEPYGATDPGGPGIIAYGLGNLFFDQMFSWETRSELIARHAIYDGQVISTEILTAALENYAQPRWTTQEERAEILTRIFEAAPPRP